MSHKKPTNILKLHGTFKPSRHDSNEPKPPTYKKIPEPPEHFNEYSIKEWNRVIPELVKLDLIGMFDISLLENAIEQYGIYKEAYFAIYYETYLDKAGKRRKRKRTLVDYLASQTKAYPPELTIMRHSLNSYKELMYKFGATPVERTRIKMQPVEVKNDMEELLGNANSK